MNNTITLFGLALKGNNYDYEVLAKKALAVGYIVDKEASTKEVSDFLDKIKVNVNSTFYKTFKDVTDKNRFELFIDQVIHYGSTYGTNREGEVYLPHKGSEDLTSNFKEYKVIKAATQEEIIERCNNLLYSGIAMDNDTIKDVFSIYERFNFLPDLEKVKNKESKMRIFNQRNILPSSNEEFLRYLIFLATDKTSAVKDKETLKNIYNSGYDISHLVDQFGIEKFSEIFLRSKAFLLAFKKANKANIKVVNRLRKLSNKNHKPYKFGFFEDILTLNDFSKLEKLGDKLKGLNPFKKVSLLEAIKERLGDSNYNSYVIRNGKFFIKERKRKYTKLERDIYGQMLKEIYQSLVKDISRNKGKTFFIPEYLNLKVPKSEKTFIGNLPVGTEIVLPKDDLVIGINWRGEDGAQDFDLSYIDKGGMKIGWNADFYNDSQSVIYSGDMTSAYPEATELLAFKKPDTKGLIKVNRYDGKEGSLFNLLIAKKEIEHVDKFQKRKDSEINAMMKKEDILLKTQLTSISQESVLGIKTDKSFIIQNIRSSNKEVSNGTDVSTAYIEHILATQDNLVDLRKLMLDGGMIEIKEEQEKIKIDFDLRDPKRDDIINILSK